MTYADLVDRVAACARIQKNEARRALDWAWFHIAEDVMRGGQTKIVGFGTYSMRTRKARTVINVADGKKHQLPRSTRLGFKPSRRQVSP